MDDGDIVEENTRNKFSPILAMSELKCSSIKYFDFLVLIR
jgi:hypothetical protein